MNAQEPCKHTFVEIKVIPRTNASYLHCGSCGEIFPFTQSQNIHAIEKHLESIARTLLEIRDKLKTTA